ncbi:AI-2E family transporter [bacterium]|nr:AI-2E family transporter [bacterium]
MTAEPIMERDEPRVTNPAVTFDPGPNEARDAGIGAPIGAGEAGDQPANPFVARHPFLVGYGFLALLAGTMLASHLTTFVLAFVFLYLISDVMTNDVRRLMPILPKALLFSVLYVAVIALLTVFFLNTLPNVLRQVPQFAVDIQTEAINQFEAANVRWNLTQYVDPMEVRSRIFEATGTAIKAIALEMTSVYKVAIYFIFALVINLLLYHDTSKVDAVFARRPGSLMSFLYRFLMTRARTFYFFLKRVMGGQIIISAINTVISAAVIFALGLPKPVLLIAIVFTCGLFPVVGNLVSNSILTAIALISYGPLGAVICLGLLIVIHKLEYFLNSKIIGDIVKLPMSVTLASLVICEVLLGVVGLMLAIPLVLFLRHELERVPGLGPLETSAALAGSAVID